MYIYICTYIYIYYTIYQQKDAVTLWSPPTQHKLPRTTGLVGEGQVGVFGQSVGKAGLKPHTDNNVSLVIPCLRRTMTNLFYGSLWPFAEKNNNFIFPCLCSRSFSCSSRRPHKSINLSKNAVLSLSISFRPSPSTVEDPRSLYKPSLLLL